MMLRVRRFSFGQILLASVLGVFGGIYIYLPVFRPDLLGQQQSEKDRDAGARGDGQRKTPN